MLQSKQLCLIMQCYYIYRRLGLSMELCTGLVGMRETVSKHHQKLHIEEELMDNVREYNCLLCGILFRLLRNFWIP